MESIDLVEGKVETCLDENFEKRLQEIEGEIKKPSWPLQKNGADEIETIEFLSEVSVIAD